MISQTTRGESSCERHWFTVEVGQLGSGVAGAVVVSGKTLCGTVWKSEIGMKIVCVDTCFPDLFADVMDV